MARAFQPDRQGLTAPARSAVPARSSPLDRKRKPSNSKGYGWSFENHAAARFYLGTIGGLCLSDSGTILSGPLISGAPAGLDGFSSALSPA